MFGPDQMIDDVGSTGVASTVAEPVLADVAVDESGEVVDAAVAVGRLHG